MSDYDIIDVPDDGAMEVVAGPESRYFSGHFPDAPVFPAVAQLVLVEALLRRRHGSAAWISGVVAIRFVRPIRPGERVALRLDEQSDGRSAFTIECGAQRVSEGVIRWSPGGRP